MCLERIVSRRRKDLDKEFEGYQVFRYKTTTKRLYPLFRGTSPLKTNEWLTATNYYDPWKPNSPLRTESYDCMQDEKCYKPGFHTFAQLEHARTLEIRKQGTFGPDYRVLIRKVKLRNVHTLGTQFKGCPVYVGGERKILKRTKGDGL